MSVHNSGNTKVGQRGSGHLAVSSSVWVAGLIKPAQRHMLAGRLGWGQTGKGRGVYEPAFNLLSHPGRPTEESRGFKPDPGNLAVRDYRGASGNVSHGGTVNPSCDRKSRNGNPSPTAGRARFLSQWGGSSPLSMGQLGKTGTSPRIQRKAAAFVRWHEPDDARVSSPVVCPVKASMFSRRQTCRGKSQAPRSWDSRVAGNQDSGAYRRGLSSGRLRVIGP